MPASVTLISHTPEPEKLIAAAGRLCYSSVGATQLLENLNAEKIVYFVNLLTSQGHSSTLEHANFTFAIEGVSRSLLAQITRHRIASFSVQSQRYVSLENFEHIISREIEDDPEANAEYLAAMQSAKEHYVRIVQILQTKHQSRFEALGMDSKAAKSKARRLAGEDARAVLPNACETKMLMTMNARSLHNFFSLRCCARAQTEIRELADMMLALVKVPAPLLFAKAGPPCVRAGCPEGAMSCGKIAEMRERYATR